jgi:hypothetical protein
MSDGLGTDWVAQGEGLSALNYDIPWPPAGWVTAPRGAFCSRAAAAGPTSRIAQASYGSAFADGIPGKLGERGCGISLRHDKFFAIMLHGIRLLSVARLY